MTEQFARNFLLTVCMLLLTTLGFAESVVVSQTKTKLKDLENKINRLQHTLSTAHDKQSVFSQELASTEKQIGESIRELHKIEQTIGSKQHKITTLQKQVATLSEKLKTQQALLAKHMRTRYKMGEYQPVKWLLNQDNPYAMNRLLTYYQYLVKSRQRTIEAVHATTDELTVSKSRLDNEIMAQRQLAQQIQVQQKKLEQDKLYHKALIQTLNQDIQTTQQKIAEYQRNKANLSRLLTSLVQKSIASTHHPFTQMRRKLPRPVQTGRNALQKMNQGVTFFAKEGEPVVSVYAGKVVFSDWLKGYGLLLIVDHGMGFMTLYAHNQSLFKRKGDPVLQGEQIASIGHSGGLKQNGLYFEVRHRGKAIPPLEWLS